SGRLDRRGVARRDLVEELLDGAVGALLHLPGVDLVDVAGCRRRRRGVVGSLDAREDPRDAVRARGQVAQGVTDAPGALLQWLLAACDDLLTQRREALV